MLCRICPGSGWIAHMWRPKKDGPSVLEYWRCPTCGGNGARIVYGPPTIGPAVRKAVSNV